MTDPLLDSDAETAELMAAAARAKVLEAEVARLRAALTEIAAPTRVYEDNPEGDTCAECGGCVTIEFGLEPAPECHPCSTTLLEKARDIARSAINETEARRGAADRKAAEEAKGEAPTKVRSCNRHGDCDAADARAKANHEANLSKPRQERTITFPYSEHCHDDDCEDCFGR